MTNSKTAILLHIGSQKTGTTSIQRVLSANANRLEAADVLYPVSGRPADPAIQYGHHLLAREAIKIAQGRQPDTDSISGLLAEIEAKRPARVVISSEDFFHPDAPDVIAKSIGDTTTDIVVSLRRQDEYLNATYYTTLCAQRHGLSPEEFAQTKIERCLDYLGLLERWTAAFPRANLTVRLYERGMSPRTDAVGDFLRIAKLDHLLGSEFSQVRVHKTLPARAVAALRMLSKTNLAPIEFYNIFDATHLALAHRQEETFSYSPEYRASLMHKYHEGNVEARARYYDGERRSLFADTPFGDPEQWRKAMVWGDEAVARLMLDIGQAFRQRVYQANS
jgi:hypothetical protein